MRGTTNNGVPAARCCRSVRQTFFRPPAKKMGYAQIYRKDRSGRLQNANMGGAATKNEWRRRRALRYRARHTAEPRISREAGAGRRFMATKNCVFTQRNRNREEPAGGIDTPTPKPRRTRIQTAMEAQRRRAALRTKGGAGRSPVRAGSGSAYRPGNRPRSARAKGRECPAAKAGAEVCAQRCQGVVEEGPRSNVRPPARGGAPTTNAPRPPASVSTTQTAYKPEQLAMKSLRREEKRTHKKAYATEYFAEGTRVKRQGEMAGTLPLVFSRRMSLVMRVRRQQEHRFCRNA